MVENFNWKLESRFPLIGDKARNCFKNQSYWNVGGQLAETVSVLQLELLPRSCKYRTSTNPVYAPNTTASAESYYRQFYDRNHEENNVYDASF
jgi:hypothetical protein